MVIALFAILSRAARADVPKPFVITVVDAQTNRGVPLVELTTVNQVKFVTDSAGVVAVADPDLVGRRVFFSIRSHGYEFAKDGFGIAGRALELTPGGSAALPIKRLNVAERLYRTTGGGIYRDSVLAGLRPPLDQPLLDAQVLGQDTIQRVVYKGKIHWFWGDTNRLAYPLGHFGTSGAVSDLPDAGGLDPAVGVNYRYFADAKSGFARSMVPGDHLRWIDGATVVADPAGGGQRLVAKCDMLKSLAEPLGRKLIVYNDATDAFDDLGPLDKNEALCPAGVPFHHAVGGVDYAYFATPLPLLRVRADLESVKAPAQYEGYTCLAPGARFARADSKVERDASGSPVWAWKKNTPPLSVPQQQELVRLRVLTAAQAINPLVDVDTGAPVYAHAGSVNWNAFRKRWVMVFVAQGGRGAPSFLGEVYYAESPSAGPEGPWTKAKKIVTHDRYSLYNPAHHPFFDQQGGRVIYFEGTYSYTFSRPEKEGATPRYDYNNVMYRLDLDDPRLAGVR